MKQENKQKLIIIVFFFCTFPTSEFQQFTQSFFGQESQDPVTFTWALKKITKHDHISPVLDSYTELALTSAVAHHGQDPNFNILSR